MEAGESNASSECSGSQLGWLLMLGEFLIVKTHEGDGGGGGQNLVSTSQEYS